MSSLITTSDLQAGYDKTVIVRGVDIRVEPGEVVALLGPNGSGKTTTLLTLSGMLAPIGGKAVVLGHSIEKATSPYKLVRAGLGHVPEDRGLFPSLTVLQHLRLANTDREVEEQVLHRLPALRRLMDRRAGLLSGGEQQMLAMARALVANPKVLLLDEMSLGLAPQIVSELLHIVRRLADEGVGILLVEQHVRLALAAADRAYVLRRGDIVLQGPAHDLLQDPTGLEAAYLSQDAPHVAAS